MAGYQITIEQEYSLPVAQVFPMLADHKNFGRVLGAPVRRIKDASGSDPNGEGSVRLIGVGPVGVKEVVTRYEPNRLIEYRLTTPGPIRNHLGQIRFEDSGNGTRLTYTITFDDFLPLAGRVLGPALEQALTRGLKRLPRLARS